jgi:predicted nucleic acid-binding protein
VNAATTRIVVADANVLINLMHVARLGFCSDLPGLEFMVPDHVRQEITQPEQRAELDSALESGVLELASITDQGDIGLFADLIRRLGRGEAACLVLAEGHGWTVASDEKRRFRREAVSRIGEDRIIGTADLFVRAIETSLITVEEADADKEALEAKRFKMPFRSFREVVQPFPVQGGL